MQKTQTGLQQLYSVQILRAIAAITVVYRHTFTAPSFGEFGVDLFFLISGFVMCLLIDHRRPSAGAFVVDRVTRIVPLYWTVTTMVLLVAWIAPNVMGTTVANFWDYLLSLFFIPHFRQDGLMIPMLMPGWSLDYEMFYYGLIAIVLVIQPQRYKWILAIALTAVYAVANAGWLDTSSASYIFLHRPLWLEFILGIGCYELYKHRLVQRVPKSVALLIVVGAYLVMVAFEGKGSRLFTAGVPSFFMLLFSLQFEAELRRLQASVLRMIVHIGDASYATYLSHLFVIGFVERIVLTRLHIEKNSFTALLTIACCLVAGSVVYHFADKPLTRLARKMTRRMTASKTILGAGRIGTS